MTVTITRTLQTEINRQKNRQKNKKSGKDSFPLKNNVGEPPKPNMLFQLISNIKVCYLNCSFRLPFIDSEAVIQREKITTPE